MTNFSQDQVSGKIIGGFSAYWIAYGRFTALIRSSYLWLSLGLPLFLWPAWDVSDGKEAAWAEIAIQVLPSMVSFSLGALSIILNLAPGKFVKIITEEGAND